jgi:hypothetical protein
MALSYDQSVSLKKDLLEPGGPNTNPADQWTDVHYALMDKLDGFDLADCILQATIRGQERLVRTLMERRGPVPIVLSSDPRVPSCYNLNGESFGLSVDETVFAANAKSPAALKSLLAMIDEFGMKGLIEPGKSFPFLLKKVETNSFLMKNNVSRFDAMLPELAGGVLGQPELAIALNHESQHTSTPDAYQPMLCWASEDMVLQFPKNLAALVPYQHVDENPISQWKASTGQPGNMDFNKIVVGVKPSSACSKVIEYLHQTMTPRASRFGFSDDRGLILCETTADFLLQFPSEDCTSEDLQTAFDFTSNYCPIDIMAAQAINTCREVFGVVELRRPTTPLFETMLVESFDFLFEALKRGDALQLRVMDLMTKEQWSALYRKANYVGAHALLGLYQAFGIDNCGRANQYFAYEIAVLANGGFRFSSNTKVFIENNPFQKHLKTKSLDSEPAMLLPISQSSFSSTKVTGDHAKDMAINCMKANLWPAPGVMPMDVAAALKMASRVSFDVMSNPKVLALHAYLLNAGVEACAKAATSASQWMAVIGVFSTEELEPFRKEMPAKAKGKMLEFNLGL